MLPPITILLIGLHIYLVRRHGVAAAPEDELRVAKKFYPRQVLIDSMAIWLAFVLLFIMAVVVHVPLERLADPNDVVYVPRPEWYFLFLFQLLKFFSGPLEVFGSVILPSLAILLLILVPFIDRAPVIHITQRTVAMLFAGLFVLGWAALTGAAVKSTPSANAAESVDYSLPTEWLQCSPAELASVAAIRREKCGSCHVRGGKGPAGDLGEAGRERLEEWIATHVGEHGLKNSGEGRQLGKLLSRPTPRFKEAVQFAPDFAVQGAQVFQANGCFSCHEVNGAGRPIGPSLLGLFRRRSEAWILEHFANPQKMSPGTIMPPYHFPEIDARQLSDYLRSLPN
jgi:ubiquinol-cytochrome c reductase cytochrome b subunit